MMKSFLPRPRLVRSGSALLGLVLLGSALAGAPARAQEDPASPERIFGTRPDAVMVMVFAQFTEELDEQIWHLPLATAEVAEEGRIAITLQGLEGTTLYLPPAAGRSTEALVELVRGAVGHLVRLEYHPSQPVARGLIHASWALSKERSLVGVGPVPLGARLYSRILAVAPPDLPDTGIFAAIADAQNRYAALVENVDEGDAHRTDELLAAFRAAVEDSRTPLGFFREDDGSPVTEERLQQLADKGHIRSAELYWREAVRKFDGMEPVNATLNEFAKEWEILPPGTVIRAPYPGMEEERVVNVEVLDEFRRAAARRFLAEAVLCAEAENPWLMEDNLQHFRDEIAAAGEVGQTIDPNDFVPPEYETIDAFVAHLEHKASGRLGFWERVLAYFKTLQRNNQNFASPAGGK